MVAPLNVEQVLASEVPQAFLDIAWHRFFLERGRGLSLNEHFPWLRQADDNNLALIAFGEAALGMLVFRLGSITRPGRNPFRIAGIGLVCAAAGAEGRGTGSTLIRRAIELGRQFQVDALMLWTGRPDFYYRLGFRLADERRVASMRRNGARRSGATRISFSESGFLESPVFAGPRGIPPFARELFAFRSSHAVAVFAELNDGGTGLLDWRGTSLDVARLVAETPFEQVLINDLSDACLITAMGNSGWSGFPQNRPLAMWLPLTASCPSTEELASQLISPLDRF